MNTKRILSIFISAILLLTVFSGCGKKGKSLTVDYVGRIGTSDAALSVVGKVDGEPVELLVEHAFKDCTCPEFKPCSDKIVMSGTPEGLTVFQYPDGILVTVKNADGQTRELEIKPNVVFETVKTDEGLRLLLPAE